MTPAGKLFAILTVSILAGSLVNRCAFAEEKASPDLVKQLKEGDEAARLEAAQALGNTGSLSLEVVRGLIGALQDPSRKVAEAAEKSLASLGEKVLPDLQAELLEGANQEARLAAIRALRAPALRTPAALPVIWHLLSDASPEVQKAARKALIEIAEAAEPERLEHEKIWERTQEAVLRDHAGKWAVLAPSAQPGRAHHQRTPRRAGGPQPVGRLGVPDDVRPEHGIRRRVHGERGGCRRPRSGPVRSAGTREATRHGRALEEGPDASPRPGPGSGRDGDRLRLSGEPSLNPRRSRRGRGSTVREGDL